MFGKLCLFIFITFLFDLTVSDDLRLYIDGPSELSESDNSVKYFVYRLTGTGSCTRNVSLSNSVSVKGNLLQVFNSSQVDVSFTLIITDNDIKEPDDEITFFLDCIDDSNGLPIKFEKRIKIKDDDTHPYKSSFLMQNFLLNVLYEGRLEALYLYTLRGMANCNIKSSNTSRLEVIGNSEKFLMANLISYVMLYAVENSNIENDQTERIFIDCLDKNTNRRSFYQHEITIIDNDGENITKPIKFGLLSLEEVNEDEDIAIFVTPHSGSGDCLISLSENEIGELTGPKNFFLDANKRCTFIFKPKKNFRIKGDRRVDICLTCTNRISKRVDYSKKNILIRETSQDDPFDVIKATGDPHFTQIVSDELAESKKYVCYDIAGKAGDIINIFQKTFNGDISVLGVLKDDYYMHKISISFLSKNLSTTTDEIYLSDGRILNWEQLESYKSFPFGKHFITFAKNYIKILVESDEVNDPFLSIILKRSHHPITGYYLDVIIHGINGNYHGMDGLIGRIGNNKFKFYEPVQKTNNIWNNESNPSKVAVEINGLLKPGRIEKREGFDCWLLNTKDLLYPYSLNVSHASFLLRLESFNQMYENVREVMVASSVQGSATCNIHSSNPQRLQIYMGATIEFVPNKSVNVILEGVDNSILDGEELVTIFFVCVDKETAESSTYSISMTILDNEINKLLPGKIEMVATTTVEEGSPFEISVFRVQGDSQCRAFVSSTSDLTLKDNTYFSMTDQAFKKTLNFNVISDGKAEGNELVTITVRCRNVLGGTYIDHVVGIVIKDSTIIPFALHIIAFNYIKEGKIGHVETYAQGSGYCSVTSSYPQRLEIIQGKSLIFDNNLIEIGVLFEAKKNNQVDENQMVFLNFHCTDSNTNEKTNSYVSLTIIDADGLDYFYYPSFLDKISRANN
ncbi:DgyrCDS8597 [Dimorphilus gyrociliatus]|uniref:DgyrCDS8597 n=1 Tax=Dimorphilus gyrociliatus TaxID=2664684 RepID=A0A7I8VZR8_9ANNE|nr:DgyrCDS8597 [Dimorphilus gyrociliatus]